MAPIDFFVRDFCSEVLAFNIRCSHHHQFVSDFCDMDGVSQSPKRPGYALLRSIECGRDGIGVGCDRFRFGLRGAHDHVSTNEGGRSQRTRTLPIERKDWFRWHGRCLFGRASIDEETLCYQSDSFGKGKRSTSRREIRTRGKGYFAPQPLE